MLDTLAIRADWPLREPRTDCRNVQLSNTSPVRVILKAGLLVRAEVSLPRLWFGHNGRVLENQKELDAALAKFSGDLNGIAVVPEIAVWKICRADIAWNFDLRAAPLVFAHAPLHLPGIHRGATLYPDGEGVSWGRAKSGFMVELYDKAKKMHVPGSVLRAEIRLRGRQLARRLKGDWRSFDELYRTYRSLMVSIPAISKPPAAADWQEALGAHPWEIRQSFLACLAHKPSGTFRRYRRRVETAAANLPEDFSWTKILPVDGPPPPVHVEPRKPHKNIKR